MLQMLINQYAESLGLDITWVSGLIYAYGCEFARKYYFPRSALIAEGNSLYWHWWLYQWYRVDNAMKNIPAASSELYSNMHSPDCMLKSKDFRPQPWEEVTDQIHHVLFRKY